jgi:hypothetical protein
MILNLKIFKKLAYLITITLLLTSTSNSEIKKVDSFFSDIGGRFIYEAEFDEYENIIRLIHINDFKELKSSNGCFNINDFSNDSRIYKFLKKKKLKKFCNK